MKYEFIDNKLHIQNDKFNTIEEFLNHFKQSKKNKYLLLQNKQILINDEVVKYIHTNIFNKQITLILEDNKVDWKPSSKKCEIIYEDPFVLIVHKQAGIIIHSDTNEECLNNEVARYYVDHDIHTTIRPIHRLDKETTGLVIYSKIPFFQPYFDYQLEEKRIHREYLAVVIGNRNIGDIFTVNKPIGRDRHISNKYRISKNGKDSITHFEVIGKKHGYNLIRCTLETGRTHQIRVHLSSIGLPIVNDSIYGIASSDFKEMGLFAQNVTFYNPLTNKKHKIKDLHEHFTHFFK